MLVPLTDAKLRLHELVRQAADEDVVLLRHGRPVAVLVQHRRFEELVEEIEELRDQISVLESERAADKDRVTWESTKAELGLSSARDRATDKPRRARPGETH